MTIKVGDFVMSKKNGRGIYAGRRSFVGIGADKEGKGGRAVTMHCVKHAGGQQHCLASFEDVKKQYTKTTAGELSFMAGENKSVKENNNKQKGRAQWLIDCEGAGLDTSRAAEWTDEEISRAVALGGSLSAVGQAVGMSAAMVGYHVRKYRNS